MVLLLTENPHAGIGELVPGSPCSAFSWLGQAHFEKYPSENRGDKSSSPNSAAVLGSLSSALASPHGANLRDPWINSLCAVWLDSVVQL